MTAARLPEVCAVKGIDTVSPRSPLPSALPTALLEPHLEIEQIS